MGSRPKLGTHCPITKAADLLGDRWVLQIIRAMMLGATRYGELQQAVPRISPTVLSARLKQMVEDGLIVKREDGGGRSAAYRLTPSGRELRPMIKFLGRWGLKWSQRNIRGEKIDIGGMMWDLHRLLRVRELPDGESVIAFSFTDVEDYARWWIVVNGRTVDLWPDNPGKDVDIYLTTTVADLLDVWLARKTVREALAEGALIADGRNDLVRSIGNWFPMSPIAGSSREETLEPPASDGTAKAS